MPKALTQEIFLERARKVHGNKYDYSLTEYKYALEKVIIICPKHGKFEQTPANHCFGKGCRTCATIKNSKKRKLKLNDFIAKATVVHKNQYDYSKVKYENSCVDITIICPLHGEFKQKPAKHLCGQGCPQCGIVTIGNLKRSSTNEFIEKAKKIHGDIYDYSLVNYKKANLKVEIICNKHGSFLKTPNKHLCGQGCPICADYGPTSKIEAEWLDFLEIPLEFRHFQFIFNDRKFIVDGYNPKTNTIYEFYGDFWHGNPEVFEPDKKNKVTGLTYQSLYQKTMKREKLLRDLGFNLVTIWENDWNKIKVA